MSATVPRITSAYTDVTVTGEPLRVAEIHLGVLPRGIAILLLESGGLGDAVVAPMNGLAEHGYESDELQMRTWWRQWNTMITGEALPPEHNPPAASYTAPRRLQDQATS